MTPTQQEIADAVRLAEMHGGTVVDYSLPEGPQATDTTVIIATSELAALIAEVRRQKGEDAVVWPKSNRVERREDMSPTGKLIIGLDADNDVCLTIVGASDPDYPTLEFCQPGSGGGKSPNTRKALLALMVAIEADEAIRARLEEGK